jgi:hypothetical protein
MALGHGHEQMPPATEAGYAIGVVLLVLGAGLMSGLTLGLLSLDVLDLRVLQASGSARQKLAAARLIPLVEKPHWLLCTLLLCNAACMEVRMGAGRGRMHPQGRPIGPYALAPTSPYAAPRPCVRLPAARACSSSRLQPALAPHTRGAKALPLFLDRLLDPVAAICLSVTAILLFGAP